jgi:hypothetical protein
VSPDRKFQIKAVATFMIVLFALALTPVAVSAQSLNGSLYAAQGGSVPVAFAFSVSGSTFVVFILTFGPSGMHGRWFVAAGTTDGVSGTGQLLSPTALALPSVGTMQFQLDQPGAPTGSFTTQGLEGILSLTSGRFVRIFP